MNVVDSSGWLEYFSGSRNAEFFGEPIEDTSRLIVPSITIVEVFKKILQERDEPSALQAASLMNQGRVIDLDRHLAMKAAKMGFLYKIPLADSIILATASMYHAVLWTQDEDFKGLPDVRFIPKRK